MDWRRDCQLPLWTKQYLMDINARKGVKQTTAFLEALGEQKLLEVNLEGLVQSAKCIKAEPMRKSNDDPSGTLSFSLKPTKPEDCNNEIQRIKREKRATTWVLPKMRVMQKGGDLSFMHVAF